MSENVKGRAPYWVRIRGTGQKVGDWDKGISFNCQDEYKGTEILLATEFGSVVVRAYKDDETQLTMLAIKTIPHRDWTGQYVGNTATLYQGPFKITEPVTRQASMFD